MIDCCLSFTIVAPIEILETVYSGQAQPLQTHFYLEHSVVSRAARAHHGVVSAGVALEAVL